MTALNRILAEQFPSVKTIYLDTCPVAFDRPSFFMECTGSIQSDATYATYLVSDTFEINAFPVLDEYGCAGDEQLLKLRGELLALFRNGYLCVGDRAVKISEVKTGGDTDFAAVGFKAEYFESRTDQPCKLPKIEAIKTTIIAK